MRLITLDGAHWQHRLSGLLTGPNLDLQFPTEGGIEWVDSVGIRGLVGLSTLTAVTETTTVDRISEFLVRKKVHLPKGE